MESRSLAGASLIKVYFQPGPVLDSAVTTIASLAMEISHLPPGTLPPFVLKMDASSLPVCLVTLKGNDLYGRRQLKDLAQNALRNQLAGVPGAAVPQPFGGRWWKSCCMPTHTNSKRGKWSDIVRAMNEANSGFSPRAMSRSAATTTTFTPTARSTRLATSTMFRSSSPATTLFASPISASPSDAYALQYNAVRVDGQRSVYLPVLKQGATSNTITVVDGVREPEKLFDVRLLRIASSSTNRSLSNRHSDAAA